MELKDAIKVLQSNLLSDQGYKISWISNIAVSYFDAERSYKSQTGKSVLNEDDKYAIANLAAELFINRLTA